MEKIQTCFRILKKQMLLNLAGIVNQKQSQNTFHQVLQTKIAIAIAL